VTVAGVLLAAGGGRRFGGPKALVAHDGELLVERGVGLLADAGCSPVVVVLGARSDEVVARARLDTAETVVNDGWEEGIGSSVRVGLTDAARRPDVEAAVIALVDHSNSGGTLYVATTGRPYPMEIASPHGGAAGAVPPLVGWAAVTGSVSGTAVLLFFIVFFWTPPHFWALSLLMKDEYARVGVPMLPVVRGEAETRRQILLYTVLLYAVTQLPFCAGGFGTIYLVASMLLGFGFIAGAIRLYRRADRRSALALYLYSLAYLALLFCAMVADAHL